MVGPEDEAANFNRIDFDVLPLLSHRFREIEEALKTDSELVWLDDRLWKTAELEAEMQRVQDEIDTVKVSRMQIGEVVEVNFYDLWEELVFPDLSSRLAAVREALDNLEPGDGVNMIGTIQGKVFPEDFLINQANFIEEMIQTEAERQVIIEPERVPGGLVPWYDVPYQLTMEGIAASLGISSKPDPTLPLGAIRINNSPYRIQTVEADIIDGDFPGHKSFQVYFPGIDKLLTLWVPENVDLSEPKLMESITEFVERVINS